MKPLPDYPGPKLECFTDDITKHNFKVLDYLGGGCHSQVYKFEIDGKIYAVKLFNYDGTQTPTYRMWAFGEDPIDEDEDDEPMQAGKDGFSQSTIDSLLLDSTSFHCECRAYGRLKELNREHLAVKAYGYIRLDLTDKKVQQSFCDWDNSRWSESNPRHAWFEKDVLEKLVHEYDLSRPMFGIVKDLAPKPPSDLSPRELFQRYMDQMPQQLRNVHELHKSGIVLRDLKAVQYIDGQLVDFSHAWTIPHIFDPEGGIRPRWVFESMAALDLKCFQDMINSCWYSISQFDPPLKMPKLVAWRDDEVLGRLRSRPQMYGPFLPLLAYDHNAGFMKHHPPYDPAQFNWKAIQKKSSKTSPGRVTKRKAATRGGKGKTKRNKKTETEKTRSKRTESKKVEESEDVKEISVEVVQE
ncbi:hypothetical protein FHETE_668 [Fusarium heterosporum]|uniref:Protein kinase domain-containing protein n=1 Tax=Fusarium heterosporum TaxID=42747 RepID=A0A8H5U4S8_FUSHE|nr:hypothetical protein FHETE_668 [Fusarium heterosporum]